MNKELSKKEKREKKFEEKFNLIIKENNIIIPPDYVSDYVSGKAYKYLKRIWKLECCNIKEKQFNFCYNNLDKKIVELILKMEELKTEFFNYVLTNNNLPKLDEM